MKKIIIITVSVLCLNCVVIAQQSETNPAKGSVNQKVFKVFNNPTEDKTDLFEIIGAGSTSFTASNTIDGTTESYNHALNVIVTLIPSNKSAGNNFQMHFYSPSQNIQQAANYKDGVLNIYYPISLYEPIREKLDQAIAAKKKIILKVVQRKDGYREGSLQL